MAPLPQIVSQLQPGTPDNQPVDDEVGLRLEELAGVHSFEMAGASSTDGHRPRAEEFAGVHADLLDAFEKVDAAREALSRVVTDSGMRHSAPAFVPGQLCPGQQLSSFVD